MSIDRPTSLVVPMSWADPFVTHQVTNDAMEPRFKRGDIVVFDGSVDTFVTDGIYLLRMGDRDTVCRVQGMLSGFRVFYDNAAFSGFDLSADDMRRVTIVGMAHALFTKI